MSVISSDSDSIQVSNRTGSDSIQVSNRTGSSLDLTGKRANRVGRWQELTVFAKLYVISCCRVTNDYTHVCRTGWRHRTCFWFAAAKAGNRSNNQKNQLVKDSPLACASNSTLTTRLKANNTVNAHRARLAIFVIHRSWPTWSQRQSRESPRPFPTLISSATYHPKSAALLSAQTCEAKVLRFTHAACNL